MANDIVVHNRRADGDLLRERGAEGKKAAALFSLEMSESELARLHRVAGVDQGRRLRKGNVPPSRCRRSCRRARGWPSSPLIIDDSSDLSVLEVGRSARRLAQQHADGLGLVVIDYLQLCARRDRREPRGADLPDLARPQDAGRELRGAGDRALAAQPRRRAARRTSGRSWATCASPAPSSRTRTS